MGKLMVMLFLLSLFIWSLVLISHRRKWLSLKPWQNDGNIPEQFNPNLPIVNRTPIRLTKNQTAAIFARFDHFVVSDGYVTPMEKEHHWTVDELKEFNKKVRASMKNPACHGNASCICADEETSPCILPHRAMISSIRISAPYKLLACSIRETHFTAINAMMCFLHNTTRFHFSDRRFMEECEDVRFCEDENEYHDARNALMKSTISDGNMDDVSLTNEEMKWQYFLVVRDPMERFLQAFMDRCIKNPTGKMVCNTCKRNMTCFLEGEYERMLKESTAKVRPVNMEDHYFLPQNWHCNMRRDFSRYKILRISENSEKMAKFELELFDMLKKRNVSDQSIEFIKEQMADYRNATVNGSLEMEWFEKYLKKSPYLMELFVRMYYHDYAIFGFDLPVMPA